MSGQNGGEQKPGDVDPLKSATTENAILRQALASLTASVGGTKQTWQASKNSSASVMQKNARSGSSQAAPKEASSRFPSSSSGSWEAPCGHPQSDWRKLRLKRGMTHYSCKSCATKWKVTHDGVVLHSLKEGNDDDPPSQSSEQPGRVSPVPSATPRTRSGLAVGTERVKWCNGEFDPFGRRIDAAGVIVYSKEAETDEWYILLGRQSRQNTQTRSQTVKQRDYLTHIWGYFDADRDCNIFQTANRRLSEFTRNLPIEVGEDYNGEAPFMDLPYILPRGEGSAVETMRTFTLEVPADQRENLVKMFRERKQIRTRGANLRHIEGKRREARERALGAGQGGEESPIANPPPRRRGYPAQAFDEDDNLKSVWDEVVELKWYSQKELIGMVASEGVARYIKGGSVHFTFRRTYLRLLLPSTEGGLSVLATPTPKLRHPLSPDLSARWESSLGLWGSFLKSMSPDEATVQGLHAYFKDRSWDQFFIDLAAGQGSEIQRRSTGGDEGGMGNAEDGDSDADVSEVID